MRRPALLAAALLSVFGCESDPGLLREKSVEEPCHLGEVKACTCDDGHQASSTCGLDGVFAPCGCGGPMQVTFADAASSPVDSRDATVGPRPRRDASEAPADAVTALLEPDVPAETAPDAGAVSADAAPIPPDAAPLAPDAARDTCADAPESVRLDGFEIFRYEASHPAATAEVAFPGAVGASEEPVAGGPPGDACSRAGVRPWHSVTAEEAAGACARIGWRLCRASELTEACGGGERDWTFGTVFDAGACNLLQVYTSDGGATTSESPTGAFPDCHSPEGVYDLTGNLWEWAEDRPAFLGGGWRIIPEMHRETDLVCSAEIRAQDGYRGRDVGFRCCR